VANNRLNQTRLLSQNLLPGFAWQVLRQSQARWLSARYAEGVWRSYSEMPNVSSSSHLTFSFD